MLFPEKHDLLLWFFFLLVTWRSRPISWRVILKYYKMYDEFCNDSCVWSLVLPDKGDSALMTLTDTLAVLDVCVGAPRSTNEYKIIFRSWVPKIDFFWIIRVHHSAYSFEESRSVALCWSSAFKHIISIGSVHSLWLQ